MAAEKVGQAQSVRVVEADMLDKMNETNALMAQRVYELFESRGDRGPHSEGKEDWFAAQEEVLHPLDVLRTDTDSGAQLTAQVPGFDAKDLEVAVGHRRAVICGLHADSIATQEGHTSKVMRIVELPFEIDPALATATLEQGTLQVILPRSR